jgi:hypothetical protein
LTLRMVRMRVTLIGSRAVMMTTNEIKIYQSNGLVVLLRLCLACDIFYLDSPLAERYY